MKAASASIVALVFVALLASCSEKAVTMQKNTENARLVGVWGLKAKLTMDGAEDPAIDHQMRLSFNDDDTFRAEFKANDREEWIKGGQGSFSLKAPLLSLYWENGRTQTFVVEDKGQDRLILHHSYNLVPVKDQESSEVFVRQKGPTRKGA